MQHCFVILRLAVLVKLLLVKHWDRQTDGRTDTQPQHIPR